MTSSVLINDVAADSTSPWPARLATLVLFGWATLCFFLPSGNPGWHGKLGFPFTFLEWSDAIITINGETTGSGFSLPALVADLVLGVSIPILIFQAPAWRRAFRSRGSSTPTS